MELLVVGGDKRHAALCELARARGWHVMSMGLPGSLPCAGLADAAVLPMPYAREGRVPAPLLSDAPDIVSVLEHVRPGARVYCGGADEALNMLAQEKRLKIIDLYKDEAFARRGALPSAEGAIYALMRERDEMVAGAHVLIVGFGRLGQALALMLTGMGAHVRVAARREESRALADVMGCESAAMDALYIAVKGMSAIFNTVPARVIDERTLLNMDAGAIIVETASAPYGVDFESARALGVRVLKEGGIPGRYCPRTAAAIILDAIERDAAKSEGGIENG